MGNEKRQRKKANRAARLESELKAARRRHRIRRIITLAAITIGALVVALLFSLFSGGDDDTGDAEQGAAMAVVGTEPRVRAPGPDASA